MVRKRGAPPKFKPRPKGRPKQKVVEKRLPTPGSFVQFYVWRKRAMMEMNLGTPHEVATFLRASKNRPLKLMSEEDAAKFDALLDDVATEIEKTGNLDRLDEVIAEMENHIRNAQTKVSNNGI